MKSNRQRKIIELITENNIETQEDLANMLIDSGFSVTQATVSRDIRELSLTKVSDGKGKQKYALPTNTNIVVNSKYMRVLNDGILAVKDAGNIIVIKTVSGMAMAVGAAVDAINLDEIVGTIAGDDTVFCAISNAYKASEVIDYLEKFII